MEELTKITNVFLESKRNKYAILPELRQFIGDNVVIGSNVFLTESIPCDHKVKMSKPELVVIKKGEGKC